MRFLFLHDVMVIWVKCDNVKEEGESERGERGRSRGKERGRLMGGERKREGVKGGRKREREREQ